MSHPSVVRIFATTQDPDYDCPWQALTPSSSTGSGVVVGPGRILTGAHVVANATFIQVQKISEPKKATAAVEAVCHDCDLALLTVRDAAFMRGIRPAELGELPDLRDRVSVVGFPVGGEEISVTEGVVSRIEVQRYSHSQRRFLAVTVDAAINEGNSGGPVFQDGKVAGIAFQKLESADNVGEMVPAPLIRHFLAGVDAGRPSVLPGLGITTQTLENPALRSRLGLGADDTGILVLSVEYGGSAWGALRPGDALLAIDGMRIANNGTTRYLGRYRTRFDALLGQKFVGERLRVEILRDGQRLDVDLELRPLVHLVPRSRYDRLPSYFVYGGLVFQPLSRDFLATWESWWEKAPKEFLHYYYSGARTAERQQIVVLSQVLADEISVGYEDLYSESITSVNGSCPPTMAALVRAIDASTDLVEMRTSSGAAIVLDAKLARAATPRILERYHIHSDRSADLRGLTPAADPSPRRAALTRV